MNLKVSGVLQILVQFPIQVLNPLYDAIKFLNLKISLLYHNYLNIYELSLKFHTKI